MYLLLHIEIEIEIEIVYDIIDYLIWGGGSKNTFTEWKVCIFSVSTRRECLAGPNSQNSFYVCVEIY